MEMNDLSKRIERLEDIEAIQQLKYEYFAACDDSHNADRIVAIFTEDGIWDGGPFGYAKGHKEIWDLFHNTHHPNIILSQHNGGNPVIKIDGDTAHGIWQLACIPMTVKPIAPAFHTVKQWVSCQYEEDYVKVNGKWLMKKLVAKIIFVAPYEQGW